MNTHGMLESHVAVTGSVAESTHSQSFSDGKELEASCSAPAARYSAQNMRGSQMDEHMYAKLGEYKSDDEHAETCTYDTCDYDTRSDFEHQHLFL